MITDDNEEIEVDGINYSVRILRQIIRGIKKGCPVECSTLPALQQFERDRRNEMAIADGYANEQKRIAEVERKTDD